MHWIARHILKELAVNDRLRYTQLIPPGVEGNMFQYHARRLEQMGLIVRDAEGYRLTEQGRFDVSSRTLVKSMVREEQPRPVTMIVARNDKEEYLLFRWRRQPYRGKVSLPFGRHILGRTSHAMAMEQLHFKTGYKADLTYVGLVELRWGQLGTRSSDHLLVTVFEATNLRGQQATDGLTGESFWGRWRDVPEPERLAGLEDIMHWLEGKNRPPYLELAF